MSDRAQFVILAEDLQAGTFVWRALRASGANPHRIRTVSLPSRTGGGAGHAYVLENYAVEVARLRGQHARTALVVHIDADTSTVAERHRQLASRLTSAGAKPRRGDEPIAELVPKRNIETWIYALDEELAAKVDQPLDEEQSYPKLKGDERACAASARAFADHAKHHTNPERANEIPSLLDGLEEFRRLP